jgi:toxin-antitoxin system PIN domain toxin
VILVDTNLLIYAVDADAPNHRLARRWFEAAVSRGEHVGLPWVVLLAFLRITTREGILDRPLPANAALAYVDEWLRLPTVEAVGPGPQHWRILRNLLRTTGTAGNLTSDAHLAALAIERGAAVYSTDHDFGRFAGVEHVDPLARRQ